MNDTPPPPHDLVTDLGIDRDQLRAEVSAEYAAVAADPGADYHFHTGRIAAERCRYDGRRRRPAAGTVESFAGVAKPFELRPLRAGERVVDPGSGSGFDCFMGARTVGPFGHVIGVDMTMEMVAKSRAVAATVGADGRVSQRLSGGVARRGRVGGRGDLQRRDQSLPRQGRGADGGVPNPSTRRRPPVRRHRKRARVPIEAQRNIDVWTG